VVILLNLSRSSQWCTCPPSGNDTYSEPTEVISIAPEKMKKYVGRYLFDVENILTINEENGNLYANIPSFNKTEILPISEQKVVLKDKGISLELVKDQESDSDFLVISGKYLMDTIFAQRIDKKPHTPYEKLVDGNIDEAIEIYKGVHETDPLNLALAEDRFNAIGYELLNKKKYSAAIAIFKLNTAFYPESYNTFDSLAEAYMKAGKNELAISNYEISLKLNPDNENAKNMLVELK
jgi:tetratricopeptide (TPR) repeat protein